MAHTSIVEEGNIVWQGERTDKPLTYAFTYNGIRYFHFSSLAEMPTYRALTANVFFKEQSEGMEANKTNLIFDAMEQAINKGNLVETAKLLGFAKDVRRVLFIPDIYYKLASVYYLDENESPVYFDYGYNMKKINGWMKGGVKTELDFFYRSPIKELMPSSTTSESDMMAYLKLMRRVEANQLQYISEMPYKNMLTQDSLNYLASQMEALENWNESNEYLLENITFLSSIGLFQEETVN